MNDSPVIRAKRLVELFRKKKALAFVAFVRMDDGTLKEVGYGDRPLLLKAVKYAVDKELSSMN